MPDIPAGAVIPSAADLPAGGGSVRPVVQYPDPGLRTACAPAGELKFAELRGIVADLFATMYAAAGRGLAAPQIDVMRRVFVMDPGWKDGAPAPLAVIEPQIVGRSDRTAVAEERCLSIPDHPVRVRRPVRVRLAFFDLDGNAQELALEGTAARIAQHELDHLDGVLILDAGRETGLPARPPDAPLSLAGPNPAFVARAQGRMPRPGIGDAP